MLLLRPNRWLHHQSPEQSRSTIPIDRLSKFGVMMTRWLRSPPNWSSRIAIHDTKYHRILWQVVSFRVDGVQDSSGARREFWPRRRKLIPAVGIRCWLFRVFKDLEGVFELEQTATF